MKKRGKTRKIENGGFVRITPCCNEEFDINLGGGIWHSYVCDKIFGDVKNGKFGEDFKESANTITNPAIHQSMQQVLLACFFDSNGQS